MNLWFVIGSVWIFIIWLITVTIHLFLDFIHLGIPPETGYEIHPKITNLLLNKLNPLTEVKLKGKDNGLDRPVIYMCNHKSYVDAEILCSILKPGTKITCTKYWVDNIVIGPSFYMSGQIPIDFRLKNGKWITKDINKVYKQCKYNLDNNKSILVFPESTFNSFKIKYGFVKFAMKYNIPIQTFRISDLNDIYCLQKGIAKPGTFTVEFKELIENTKDYVLEELANKIEENIFTQDERNKAGDGVMHDSLISKIMTKPIND